MNDKFKLKTEEWECRACGDDVPCKISITYEPLEALGFAIDKHERFQRRKCICEEPRATNWKLITKI